VTALALEVQQRSTESFIRRLEEEVAQSRAAVEVGALLESEALKVELALSNARLQSLRLAQQLDVALADLARTIGSDEPVRPVWPETMGRPLLDSDGEATIESDIRRALENRADLAALRAQRGAADSRSRAVRAERLPVVAALASWVYDTGGPFEDEEWLQGSVGLEWNPFAAGTRKPRRTAAEEEVRAIEAELLEAERGVALEVRAAVAARTIAARGVEVGESGVRQAAETLRVERERYRAGRITVNDLLAAEAALVEQETLRDLSRLDLVRAEHSLRHAMGLL